MAKKILFILGFFFLSFDLWGEARPDFSQKGSLPVEVIEFRDLWDTSRNVVAKPKRFRIFRRNQSQSEGGNGRNIPIKVHAPITGGPYPVVLISHGAGGNWDTHYAQANHLASQGYAVLCLEHVGSNTERMKSGIRLFHNLKKMIHDSTEVLGRPKDMSFAIDQATEWNRSHPKLKGRFDLNKVGAMGHSFGAFTVMAISGMKPALDWIEPSVSPGKGLGPDVFENRLKCGIALSPQGPGDPFFLKESYSSLRIPLMGISGTNDKQQNGEPAIARYESFKLWPEMQGRNHFLWLTNASHLDFTDSTGGAVHGRDSSNRADVQTLVRAATLLFFNGCLKLEKNNEQLLTTEEMKPYLKGTITGAEVRSK
jgi:predicted dienelactone hydrolase